MAARSSGTVDNVVYFGTDTHFHVRPDGGGEFIVRQQNTRSGDSGFAHGDRVGIAIGDDAAQIAEGLSDGERSRRSPKRPSATTSGRAGCSRRRR